MSRGYSGTIYYAGAALLFALIAVILSACGAKADGPDDPGLDTGFLTPVAAAEEAGVTVYWLGRSFEAEGVAFTANEAQFPEGTEGVAVEGLEIDYSSGGRPGGILELDFFAKPDWMLVEVKVRNPTLPGVTRRDVSAAAWKGELLAAPLGTRPLNALRLILDLGEVVLVAGTNSGGTMYPGGPDYNPFINNPDLLVQVMEENLRPYPE